MTLNFQKIKQQAILKHAILSKYNKLDNNISKTKFIIKINSQDHYPYQENTLDHLSKFPYTTTKIIKLNHKNE